MIAQSILDILKNHDITESNTEKLRNYFLNPPNFDPAKKTIVFSTPSRTGTSAFRLEWPLYAIAEQYHDRYNLIYSDNNLGPKHIESADLLIVHRAGHLHDWSHDILKVWSKTKKKPVILHDNQ